jgi:hypothetical protein
MRPRRVKRGVSKKSVLLYLTDESLLAPPNVALKRHYF